MNVLPVWLPELSVGDGEAHQPRGGELQGAQSSSNDLRFHKTP